MINNRKRIYNYVVQLLSERNSLLDIMMADKTAHAELEFDKGYYTGVIIQINQEISNLEYIKKLLGEN